jgi:hypothetical protein
MTISFIPGIHGPIFESAGISGNSYCQSEKITYMYIWQEDAGMGNVLR